MWRNVFAAKGWDKIRPIITLRNSFIHPKPTDADKYQNRWIQLVRKVYLSLWKHVQTVITFK